MNVRIRLRVMNGWYCMIKYQLIFLYSLCPFISFNPFLLLGNYSLIPCYSLRSVEWRKRVSIKLEKGVTLFSRFLFVLSFSVSSFTLFIIFLPRYPSTTSCSIVISKDKSLFHLLFYGPLFYSQFTALSYYLNFISPC